MPERPPEVSRAELLSVFFSLCTVRLHPTIVAVFFLVCSSDFLCVLMILFCFVLLRVKSAQSESGPSKPLRGARSCDASFQTVPTLY